MQMLESNQMFGKSSVDTPDFFYMFTIAEPYLPTQLYNSRWFPKYFYFNENIIKTQRIALKCPPLPCFLHYQPKECFL